MLDLHPIRTEADYETALAEIESLLEAQPGTSAANRLDVLSTLVEAYEREHFPIDLPDPIAAIRFYLDSRGLEPTALVPAIGSEAQVHQVLSRQQPLSLEMIRRLHQDCQIAAEVLIQPYPLASLSASV